MREDGVILPRDVAALIRERLSPRERIEDVVALALHIARRRARLREESPNLDDVLFAFGLWGWYPCGRRTHPDVQAGLERLRLDLVYRAHEGIFDDADRLVPDPVLWYDLGNLEDLQRESDGHRRYLAIEAGPSFV